MQFFWAMQFLNVNDVVFIVYHVGGPHGILGRASKLWVCYTLLVACQGRVMDMSGAGPCQGHVRGMSGPCQGHVRGVSI